MINENTVMKLHMLKLHAMADEFARQSGAPSTKSLSFDERFSMMVDCEFTKRENSRLTRLIKNAGFSDPGACVEGIDFSAGRKLDNSLIQKLASCEYIVSGLNVQILGATGVGKTYLSSALGISACRNSISAKYTRLPDLLIELALAKENGLYTETIKSYRKSRLLIIDDWLMFRANEDEAHMMYDLIEARQHAGSVIVCSQFDSAGWHELIDNPIAADSICDRLAHNSYKIIISGESMRKRNAMPDIIAGA
ncbi:ATPase AAA [Clostridia bacterium]|nr:ATPase AAA [Clostridia bacterium]